MLCGTIDEKSVGAFKGKILDMIARNYGADKGREFLDAVNKLSIETISTFGFTTGIDDDDIPTIARLQVDETLSNAINEALFIKVSI